MSETTHRAVQAAWEQTNRDHEFPTPDELATAIEVEADRLDELIGQLTQTLRDQGIAEHQQAHQGHLPPFLEAVAIGNKARARAEETILRQELGEAVELATQQIEDLDEDQSWRNSPDRWRTDTDLLDDPVPEIDRLTEEIWPERSARFQVMAAYLMQTRYEDSKPIPETADDPLTAQFTDLVAEELERRENVRSEMSG